MDAVYRLFSPAIALVGLAFRPRFGGAMGLALWAFLAALLSSVSAFAMTPEQVAAMARKHVQNNPAVAEMWKSGWYYRRIAETCDKFDRDGWRQFYTAEYNARIKKIGELKARIEELAKGGTAADGGEWLRVNQAWKQAVDALQMADKPYDAGVLGCVKTDGIAPPQRYEIAMAIDNAHGDIAVQGSIVKSQSTRIAGLSKEIADLEGQAAKLGLKLEPPPVFQVPSPNESLAAAVEPACKDYEHENAALGNRFVKRESAMACLGKANAWALELKAQAEAQAALIDSLAKRKGLLAKAVADATPKPAPPPPVEEKPENGKKGPKSPGKGPSKGAPPVFTGPSTSGDYASFPCPGGHTDGRICVRIPDNGTLDGLRNAFGATYDVSAASVIANNPNATVASYWSGGKMVAIDEGRKSGGDPDPGFVARYAGRTDGGYFYAALTPRAVVVLFPKKGAAAPAEIAAAPPVAAVQTPAVTDADKKPAVDASKGASTATPSATVAAPAATSAPAVPADTAPAPVNTEAPPPASAAASAPAPSAAASAAPAPGASDAPPVPNPTVSAAPPPPVATVSPANLVAIKAPPEEPHGLPLWARALGGLVFAAAAIVATVLVTRQVFARRYERLASAAVLVSGLPVTEIFNEAEKVREQHKWDGSNRLSAAPPASVKEDKGMSAAELERSLREGSDPALEVQPPAKNGKAKDAHAASKAPGADPFPSLGAPNGASGGKGASNAPADATQLGRPPAPVGPLPAAEASLPPVTAPYSETVLGFAPPAPPPDEGAPPPTQGSPSQHLAAAALGTAPTQELPQAASPPVAPPAVEPPSGRASSPPSSGSKNGPHSNGNGHKKRGRQPGHGRTTLSGTGGGTPSRSA